MELSTDDLDDLNDEEVAELARSSNYTWQFRSSRGVRRDAPADADTNGGENRSAPTVDEALDGIDAGDRQKTVSVWDGDLAALFGGLEASEASRRAVADELATAFEREAAVPDRVDLEAPDKSDVLRLAILYALNDAAPEYVDVLREVLQERAAASV